MPPEMPDALPEFQWVNGKQVYRTVDGRPFILVSNMGRGSRRRLYGDFDRCANCGGKFFRADRDTKRGSSYCSIRCSKLLSNPSQLRVQKNPKMTCDKLFSKIVRSSGKCEECGAWECESFNRLECAHGLSRRYLATRWDFRNAFCLCASCHRHYTYRPLEWDNWLYARWGEGLYGELRVTALHGRCPDLSELLVDLRSKLKAVQQS